MGSNKFTSLADGVVRTDSANLGQVQDGAANWAGVAGGTANAIAVALTPAITAYADGMEVWFQMGSAANDDDMTLNVNAIGAKSLLMAPDTEIPAGGAAADAVLGTRWVEDEDAFIAFAGLNAVERLAIGDPTGGVPSTAGHINAEAVFADNKRIWPISDVLSPVKATTSGTAIGYTSIRNDARRLTLMLNGVSGDGTAQLLLQIGDAGGLETTGYVSSAMEMAADDSNTSSTSTAGFILTAGSGAAVAVYGHVILTLLDPDNNTWVLSGTLVSGASQDAYVSAGAKSLSAVLDRLTLTWTGTPDDFDAGSINLLVE